MMPAISFNYCIPYLAAAVGFWLLFIVERHPEFDSGQSIGFLNREVVAVAAAVLFLFFFGFRGFVGFDFLRHYYPLFMEAETLSDALSFEYEKGFEVLTWLLHCLSDEWNAYVFLMTLIDVLFLHLIFRWYSPCIALSYFLFFSIDFIFEIDLMRNTKSILCVLIAMRFAHERKFLPYLLAMAVASTQHISAILFVPLFFVLPTKFSSRVYWGMFLILNLIYFLGIPMGKLFGSILLMTSPEKGDVYFSGVNALSRGITLGYVTKTVPFVITLCLIDEFEARFPYFRIFFNMYALYVCITLGFSDSGEFLRRMSYLFEPALWIIWPMLVVVLVGLPRFLFVCALFLYGVLKIYMQAKISLFCYQNILIDPDPMTYEERGKLYEAHLNDEPQ